MIRIRFHGRGGHGVKTASRIVGTAAFMAGHQCQDSPVYGAERRGAAVAAYARIADQPILERGVIANPNLIIVADETLLKDPGAAVLAGQETADAVFVNTKETSALADQFNIKPPVIGFDVTGRTLQITGVAAALSAGLGAAAARLSGAISLDNLDAAVRDELDCLGLQKDAIARNAQIASEIFNALTAVETTSRTPQAETTDVAAVEYEGTLAGTPSVFDTANAAQRQTGAWRLERPVVDRDLCTQCGLCFVMCPDAAITLDREGFPVIDYDHCKGCMICRELCPLDAISTIKETQAW